jgi:hypothetical protein
MKKFVILLSLILSVSIISAQEMPKDTINKKEIKKKKKEEREAKLQKQYEANYQMLFNRSFVLEANYIETDRKYSVSPMLNFLLVDSTNSVLQIGSLYSIGYNGAGGSTAKGKITIYDLSKNDKNKTCSLKMSVNTMAGTFNVSFDITASGNASAWVSGMYFGMLVYDGYLVPLKESKVYIGGTLY